MTILIPLYASQAKIYDLIYSHKNYIAEAQQVVELLASFGVKPGMSLLDMACGTGGHLQYFRHEYWAVGADISQEMLEVARLKGCERLHQVDMTKPYNLGRFDAVVCMFSAIGYVPGTDALFQTVKTLADHVHHGRPVVIEPWLTPEQFKVGRGSALAYDDGQIAVTRATYSDIDGNTSILDMDYVVVESGVGKNRFNEIHRLRLFSRETMIEAMTQAGLTAIQYFPGIAERGVYVGVKN